MGCKLKKFTDREWEEIERLDEILLQTTLEQMAGCMRKVNAFVEDNEEFFAKMDKLMESGVLKLLRLSDKG